MRYPLDCENSFNNTYMFWLTRFIRNKVTSLSNRQVKDKARLAQIIKELIYGFDSMSDLKKLLKRLEILELIVYMCTLYL